MSDSLYTILSSLSLMGKFLIPQSVITFFIGLILGAMGLFGSKEEAQLNIIGKVCSSMSSVAIGSAIEAIRTCQWYVGIAGAILALASLIEFIALFK